jgi:hypothetical protein
VPDIRIIHLKVDIPILLTKNLERTRKMMETQGMTLEQMWAMDNDHMKQIRAKYGEHYSDEAYGKHV